MNNTTQGSDYWSGQQRQTLNTKQQCQESNNVCNVFIWIHLFTDHVNSTAGASWANRANIGHAQDPSTVRSCTTPVKKNTHTRISIVSFNSILLKFILLKQPGVF